MQIYQDAQITHHAELVFLDQILGAQITHHAEIYSTVVGYNKSDQIGSFWKVLLNNFLTKVSPNILIYFEERNFEWKLLWLLFGQLLWKIGIIFVTVSGHTGYSKKVLPTLA